MGNAMLNNNPWESFAEPVVAPGPVRTIPITPEVRAKDAADRAAREARQLTWKRPVAIDPPPVPRLYLLAPNRSNGTRRSTKTRAIPEAVEQAEAKQTILPQEEPAPRRPTENQELDKERFLNEAWYSLDLSDKKLLLDEDHATERTLDVRWGSLGCKDKRALMRAVLK